MREGSVSGLFLRLLMSERPARYLSFKEAPNGRFAKYEAIVFGSPKTGLSARVPSDLMLVA